MRRAGARTSASASARTGKTPRKEDDGETRKALGGKALLPRRDLVIPREGGIDALQIVRVQALSVNS
jgi:hypothetical protein